MDALVSTLDYTVHWLLLSVHAARRLTQYVGCIKYLASECAIGLYSTRVSFCILDVTTHDNKEEIRKKVRLKVYGLDYTKTNVNDEAAEGH